jgi:hypothetical protein
MFELPVAAFGGNKEPAIFSQLIQYIADFHDVSVTQSV